MRVVHKVSRYPWRFGAGPDRPTPTLALAGLLLGFPGLATAATGSDPAAPDPIEASTPSEADASVDAVIDPVESAEAAQLEPELSLEDLLSFPIPETTSASKFPQPVTRAPASVTVITRDQIQKHGYRTLADILRSVRGLYVTYDRLYSFLGVRGFNPGDFNSRILLMVDGHRVNQNLSDAALIGTGFIVDVDLIQQVEVIRGPGSVLYGNNALFGVINVITRKGADFPGIGGEASFAYGTFDTYQGRASYGHSWENGFEMVLSGTIYDSQGDSDLYYPEFDQPQFNNGVFEDGDTDELINALATLSYKSFTLQGAYVDREKRNPTAQHYTTFNDNRHEITDTRWYADLKFQQAFEHDIEVIARAHYDRYEFEGTFPFSTPTPDTLEQDTRVGEWWGIEAQVNKKLFDWHMLTFGGEYRDDFNQEREYVRLEPISIDLSRSERERQNWAFFLNGDFALWPERFPETLWITAGVRYDGYDQFDGSLSPRAAVIYNPWKQGTLKAVYGSAYRTPNFFELFDPNNQDIDPETVDTYELIYEQGIGRNFRTSLVGFYNRLEDAIALEVVPGASEYRNFEGVETLGFSVELEAFGTEGWMEGIQGSVSYTFQDTQNLESNQVLVDSPEHLLQFDVSVPLWRTNVFAGFEVQYTSERASVAIGPGGQVLPGADADGFAVVNFTLFTKELLPGLEFSGSVYNIFDNQYDDPATDWHIQDLLQQNGRTFMVKLTYHF